jgi:stress 70 chaperone-associated protein
MLQAVLSVAAVVGVFVSIWAQQHLPPAKPTIVGIDLGTTYSVVAAYHTGAKGRAGRVEVMPDTDGRTSIPSVVAFTERGAVVGPAAKGQAEANPRNTIYDAKRFIGKRYDDKIQSEAQRYQFEVVEKENRWPLLPTTKCTLYGVLLPSEVAPT